MLQRVAFTMYPPIPAGDIESPVCRMAVCLDPDGNSIILHKLKSAEEKAAA